MFFLPGALHNDDRSDSLPRLAGHRRDKQGPRYFGHNEGISYLRAPLESQLNRMKDSYHIPFFSSTHRIGSIENQGFPEFEQARPRGEPLAL